LTAESQEHFVIEPQMGERRLDSLLHSLYPSTSRAYFQKLIEEGLVLVNGQLAKKSYIPEVGDDIEIGFVLDSEFHLLFDIPRPEDATNQLHALFTPTNLALDSKGRLYVSDSGAFHVQLYDKDGTFLRSVGGIGDSTGQFARVKGVAVDRDDRLYAVDALSQVTQVFDDQGRLLTWFAQPGSAGLVQNLPSKVVVDYDDVDFFQSYAAPNFKVEHLVIVINQIGPNKVSIFGFGHKK